MRIARAFAITSLALLAAACTSQRDVLVHPVFPAETVGVRAASFEDGYRLANGVGVVRDYAGARRAYAAAASAGDARAMNNLGIMALHGRGGPVDAAAALKHFRSAAQAGSHTARYNLGVAFETGALARQDLAAAAYEYRIAAEMGHAAAQARLAAMLEDGRGVPVQPEEAARLYKMATARGSAAGASGLGRLEGRQRPVTPGSAAAALFAEESCDCALVPERTMASRGLEALEKLSAAGDPAATYNLAVRLLNGQAATHDPSRAARLFTVAARQGYAPAQRQIAQMHLRGQAVAPSKVVAHAWLNMAASGEGAEAAAARSQMEALERTMHVKDVAEAQALAAAWRPSRR